jgi:ABC-type glutathione transport system ATPase component
MDGPALEVKDLNVVYETPRGPFHAVKDVSFSLAPGERFGLVGESGSGKSTTILALMRQLRGGRVTGGAVRLGDLDLLAVPDRDFRKLRFDAISLVPQGAMSSLNPVLRIADQISDIYDDHGVRHSPRERAAAMVALLGRVGLAPTVLGLFPHQLSGGMKQRVCIAMSIALKPSLILADEPTSALDVMVQKQVLATLGRVQSDIGAAVLLIGHDMALMAHFVSRIGVMHEGRLVETGPVREVFTNPRHAYTRMLIDSLPSFSRSRRRAS